MTGRVLPEIIACSQTQRNSFSKQLLSFTGCDRQMFHEAYDTCLICRCLYHICTSLQVAVTQPCVVSVSHVTLGSVFLHRKKKLTTVAPTLAIIHKFAAIFNQDQKPSLKQSHNEINKVKSIVINAKLSYVKQLKANAQLT